MQPQSRRFTDTFARKNVPRITTAHHVQNVNSIANTGNMVFRLQITNQGPIANRITISTMPTMILKTLSIFNLL